MAKLYVAYERDTGDIEALNPSIVVEMWDFVKHSMSRRRKYKELFTDTERARIREYYHTYRRWVLVTGFPKEVVMKPETYALLKRVGDFFGQVR